MLFEILFSFRIVCYGRVTQLCRTHKTRSRLETADFCDHFTILSAIVFLLPVQLKTNLIIIYFVYVNTLKLNQNHPYNTTIHRVM